MRLNRARGGTTMVKLFRQTLRCLGLYSSLGARSDFGGDGVRAGEEGRLAADDPEYRRRFW